MRPSPPIQISINHPECLNIYAAREEGFVDLHDAGILWLDGGGQACEIPDYVNDLSSAMAWITKMTDQAAWERFCSRIHAKFGLLADFLDHDDAAIQMIYHGLLSLLDEDGVPKYVGE